MLEVVVFLRCITRQPVKNLDGYSSLLPVCAADPDYSVQCVESIRHVAGIRRDAFVAVAKDSVYAIEATESSTAGTRFALIAWHRDVVKILASSALHKIPAVRRHVAKLAGCPGEDGHGKKWEPLADQRMVCRVGVLS